MNILKKILKSGLIFIILGVTLYVFFEFYPYIFSKEITGEVVGVDRLMNPQIAVVTGSDINTGQAPEMNKQIFSFSVGIKDTKTNEIHVATTEDRQWAVVKPGQCATVKFYPYPFWKLYKAGTYFNARLIKLFECEKSN